MYGLEDIQAFENLANAVIIKAAKDYKKTLRKLIKNPEDADAIHKMAGLESFFRSDWFCVLSNVDGDMVILKIQGGVEIENSDNKRDFKAD